MGLRLRAGRLRHRRDHGRARPTTSATWTSPGSSTCPCAWSSTPASPTPRRAATATTGNGAYVNSGPLDGLSDKAAGIRTIIERLEAEGTGEGTVNFRLRDWLLSRQRYWGAPIPIIHCPVDGEVAVPDDQLPVELPELRGADLKPKGTSPLGAATEWVEVCLPDLRRAGAPRHRHDGHLRRLLLVLPALPVPARRHPGLQQALAAEWGPIDLYIGGDEHAVLHLLYARFFTKALRDAGLLTWDEPFSAYLSQGKVINNGRKMSKSLGNGVDLGAQLDEFGVDAVRLTLVFASPPEDNIDWADMSPAGSLRFLQRAWRLSGDVTSAPGAPPDGGDAALRRSRTARSRRRGELVEAYRFNVMVARTMELVNATRKAIDSGAGPADPAVREAVETVAILLSMVTPYVAEEMWERLGHAARRSPPRPGPSSTRRCWWRTRSWPSCRSRAR